jgi:glycosyltransferase involved in cell wall biosynthesis
MVEVRAVIPGARLAVVGEGPLEADLRRQAAVLGLGGAVRFAPPVRPADELAAADVVAIPSRWESGPLVLTEAMALSRPVVATPVGTVTDLVVEGETGWLVPVDDAPALARALIAALADPIEARRRGAAGRQRAHDVVDAAARVSMVEAAYRASLCAR